MRFTEARSDVESYSGASTPEYQLNYMAREVKDTLSDLEECYVDYLTNSITESEIEINLKEWLGNTYYSSSNDFARECLELCLSINSLYGRRIRSWTDNALKCYDNFLLKFIQKDREEQVEPNKSVGKEREVYWHLIDLGGELQKIGQAFDSIYQERNEFQHVQVVNTDGTRTPRKFSNKKYNQKRDQILVWLKGAIVTLLATIEEQGD